MCRLKGKSAGNRGQDEKQGNTWTSIIGGQPDRGEDARAHYGGDPHKSEVFYIEHFLKPHAAMSVADPIMGIFNYFFQ